MRPGARGALRGGKPIVAAAQKIATSVDIAARPRSPGVECYYVEANERVAADQLKVRPRSRSDVAERMYWADASRKREITHAQHIRRLV